MAVICLCTGVNTKLLKDAIDNGAQRLADVYNRAREQNGDNKRCPMPEQRMQCNLNLAKAWADMTPDAVPHAVQKVIDKAQKPKTGPCGRECATCPKNKGDVVKLFTPTAQDNTQQPSTMPTRFACETGVSKSIQDYGSTPEALGALRINVKNL